MAAHDKRFDVLLEWCGPEYRSEQRWIAMERERLAAHQKAARRASFWQRLFGIGNWSGYDETLNRYERSLDAWQRQEQNGLVAAKVVVINRGPEDDRDIHVQITIAGGEFDFETPLLERPETPEGDEPSEKHAAHLSLPVLGGFARTQIELDETSMSARLSHLREGQDAYAINQVVHFRLHAHTKLHYSITSHKQAKAQTGALEKVARSES